MTIKAIETAYKGYRFRSRLEARWAVYFDVAGIQWEYEKEGYNLPGMGLYLPDFWLSGLSLWCEVKPGEFTTTERDKCRALELITKRDCIMLEGIPQARYYYTPEGHAFGLWPYKDYIWSSQILGWGMGREEPFLMWPDREREFIDMGWLIVGEEALVAARSARFEHGETP